MGQERERSRIRCLVDDFPEEARDLLESMIRDVRYTYADIVDAMTAQGLEISRSSVHRYAMRSNAAAARLKKGAEMTRQLIQQLRDNQDLESTEVASALLMDGLTRRLATAEDDFDKMPIEKAGGLLVQVQRSAVIKEKYKQDRKRTVARLENSILNRLRDLVQGDTELLNRLQAMVAAAASEELAKEDG